MLVDVGTSTQATHLRQSKYQKQCLVFAGVGLHSSNNTSLTPAGCFPCVQAMIYLDMGELSNALAQGQTALSIRQKVLSSEHPDLAHSLTGEGQLQEHLAQQLVYVIVCLHRT